MSLVVWGPPKIYDRRDARARTTQTLIPSLGSCVHSKQSYMRTMLQMYTGQYPWGLNHMRFCWGNLWVSRFRPTNVCIRRIMHEGHTACFVFLRHDDVIKWKHFPRYWPFVQGLHRWPVNSPHKGQWRGALVFSLICAWINGWVNNGEAGDLRRHRAHYDVTVMDKITTSLTHIRQDPFIAWTVIKLPLCLWCH